MFKKTFAIAASLVAAACGGGGSTGSSVAPAATPVVSHGTITGFGSVIIDGVRYETSRASFSSDGVSGSQDDFSVGQRVTVRGTINSDGSRSAGEVEYEAELHAIVDSVDLPGSSFTALGQTIRVDASTIYKNAADLSAIAVGANVEVSGSRLADGSILASYVEVEGARAELEVKGLIASADTVGKTFTIGNQPVDYSNATVSPAGFAIGNGKIVEVKGNVVAGVLIASRVQQEDDFGGAASGTQAEVEGLVADLGEGRFRLSSTVVTLSGSTVYERGTAASLANGIKLEAKGRIQADGSLAASKIEFKIGGAGSGGSKAEIQAPVTAIDGAARSLTVLGLSINVADTTVYRDSRDHLNTFNFGSLVVGDYVELGLIEVDGLLTATRVERDSNDSDRSIKAVADSLTSVSATLVIAGVTVDAGNVIYRINDRVVDASSFYGAATAGSTIKAKGSFDGTTLIASEVELDQDS